MTGYQFIVPTFVDVGSSTAKYNLQGIIPIGAAGDAVSDCLEIWTDGFTDGSGYYWCTYEGGGCAEEGQDGWYIDDMRVTDVDLPMGTGLYANFSSEDVTIQYAGQVYQGTVKTEPLNGYSIVGNSTPVPVNLQQIIPLGAAGDGVSDCIEIWEDGFTDGSGYYWCTYDGGGCAEEGQDGWYLDDERVTDVTIDPGKGFYMNLSSEDVVIQLPDPMGAK